MFSKRYNQVKGCGIKKKVERDSSLDIYKRIIINSTNVAVEQAVKKQFLIAFKGPDYRSNSLSKSLQCMVTTNNKKVKPQEYTTSNTMIVNIKSETSKSLKTRNKPRNNKNKLQLTRYLVPRRHIGKNLESPCSRPVKQNVSFHTNKSKFGKEITMIKDNTVSYKEIVLNKISLVFNELPFHAVKLVCNSR